MTVRPLPIKPIKPIPNERAMKNLRDQSANRLELGRVVYDMSADELPLLLAYAKRLRAAYENVRTIYERNTETTQDV